MGDGQVVSGVGGPGVMGNGEGRLEEPPGGGTEGCLDSDDEWRPECRDEATSGMSWKL